MSPSDTAGKARLDIRAADSSTELFVIAGDLQLVARGIGKLKTEPLDPGIYKIKARAGVETREQYVVLRDEDQSVSVPALTFASPAPLANTAKTHEYHMGAAQTESDKAITLPARAALSSCSPASGWRRRRSPRHRDRRIPPRGFRFSTGTATLSAPWKQPRASITEFRTPGRPATSR